MERRSFSQANRASTTVTEQDLRYTPVHTLCTCLRDNKFNVSLCSPLRLHPLIRSSGIDSSPLTPEQANQATEGTWAPLLSVPLHLKVSPSNPIITKPYINSSNELNDKWKATLATGIKPTIGINWQGNRTDASRKDRNIPTLSFKKLIESYAAIFVCLQRGIRHLEIEQLTLTSKLPAQQSESPELRTPTIQKTYWNTQQLSPIVI